MTGIVHRGTALFGSRPALGVCNLCNASVRFATTLAFVFHARTHSLRSLLAALMALCIVGMFGCSAQSDLPGPPRTTWGSHTIDYDPWEPFNQRTFSFNFDVLDRYALKPVAQLWSRVLPEEVRHGLANAFDNLGMPRRFVNKVLQGRLPGAGEELARFVLNTTVGVAGFFDVSSRLGLQESDADTGQTLGVYGIQPGPYLVLPILQPLTVRDAIGYAADSFMDPLSYFVTPVLANVGRSAAYTINERANHMSEYDDVEDTSLDLYAAVRNGYLQRRQTSIEEALRDRKQTWSSIYFLDHRE